MHSFLTKLVSKFIPVAKAVDKYFADLQYKGKANQLPSFIYSTPFLDETISVGIST